jgi:hypothetical protein
MFMYSTQTTLKWKTFAALAVFTGLPCNAALAEPFIGQFELKTLSTEPGAIELQSQNAWAWDQPTRRVAQGDEGELVFDENSVFRERYALEVEIGLTERVKMRVGIEGENERVDEPTSLATADDFAGLEVGEIGAEVIGVLLRREGDGVGLGFVAELEGPFDQEEPNHLTLGTIFEYQAGRWFLAAVPMVVRAFGGETEAGDTRDEKWDFAYAVQLQRTITERWSIALEGYGTVERIGSAGHPSEAAEVFGDSTQHRLGPVAYFSHEWGEHTEARELTIGLGLLEGLTSDTADHTLKFSIELDF